MSNISSSGARIGYSEHEATIKLIFCLNTYILYAYITFKKLIFKHAPSIKGIE